MRCSSIRHLLVNKTVDSAFFRKYFLLKYLTECDQRFITYNTLKRNDYASNTTIKNSYSKVNSAQKLMRN